MFVVMGIGNGAQPIFSYNHGAGLKHRVKGALWRVSLACTLVGAALFLLITWQTEAAGIWVTPAFAEGSTVLIVMMCLLWKRGGQQIYSFSLR